MRMIDLCDNHNISLLVVRILLFSHPSQLQAAFGAPQRGTTDRLPQQRLQQCHRWPLSSTHRKSCRAVINKSHYCVLSRELMKSTISAHRRPRHITGPITGSRNMSPNLTRVRSYSAETPGAYVECRGMSWKFPLFSTFSRIFSTR